MISKKKTKINLIFFLVIILLNPISIAWSDDANSETLNDQRLKLKELLDRIEETQDQRNQQKATLKKLERKMSCNMELLKDYETCEKNFKDNLEEQVTCKHEAKKKASECLSSSEEE